MAVEASKQKSLMGMSSMIKASDDENAEQGGNGGIAVQVSAGFKSAKLGGVQKCLPLAGQDMAGAFGKK